MEKQGNSGMTTFFVVLAIIIIVILFFVLQKKDETVLVDAPQDVEVYEGMQEVEPEIILPLLTDEVAPEVAPSEEVAQ
jgi:hypothetical protein